MENSEIRRQVVLKSGRDQVWRAVSESSEFGSWFGMKLEGPFRAGQKITGSIQPTKVDPEVAKMQEPHAGKPVELWVDRIEPKTLFSFKWHPFAIDPKMDYSKEPMTLITFVFKEDPGGTSLTITETGFENIPASRRVEAMKANDGGWAHQAILLSKYLAMPFAQK